MNKKQETQWRRATPSMAGNVSSRSDTSAGREATIILDYCNFSDHNSRNYKGLLKIVGNIFQPGMTNAQLLDRGGHGEQINSQNLEDTQVGYISQKYTLDKYSLEKYT